MGKPWVNYRNDRTKEKAPSVKLAVLERGTVRDWVTQRRPNDQFGRARPSAAV